MSLLHINSRFLGYLIDESMSTRLFSNENSHQKTFVPAKLKIEEEIVMVTEIGIDRQSLYKADYLKWIETTVEKLRSQDFSKVDWENLIEEIESMGRSECKSLKSNLIVVLIHLLKWQFQPELRSRSWKSSIFEHRRRIHEDIEDSPSLKPYLEEVFAKCYSNAVQGKEQVLKLDCLWKYFPNYALIPRLRF